MLVNTRMDIKYRKKNKKTYTEMPTPVHTHRHTSSFRERANHSVP